MNLRDSVSFLAQQGVPSSFLEKKRDVIRDSRGRLHATVNACTRLPEGISTQRMFSLQELQGELLCACLQTPFWSAPSEWMFLRVLAEAYGVLYATPYAPAELSTRTRFHYMTLRLLEGLQCERDRHAAAGVCFDADLVEALQDLLESKNSANREALRSLARAGELVQGKPCSGSRYLVGLVGSLDRRSLEMDAIILGYGFEEPDRIFLEVPQAALRQVRCWREAPHAQNPESSTFVVELRPTDTPEVVETTRTLWSSQKDSELYNLSGALDAARRLCGILP